MKQNKFMLSWGLAFFEQKEMKRLRKKTQEGWHLKKFSFLGYTLEEGKPEDLVYTIDYHLLEDDEREEYFEMFELGGWEYVCSQYNMHIFKAPAGTKPIYSDNETKKEKYIRMSTWWGNMSLVLFILFIISLLFRWQASGLIKEIGNIGYGITLILFVPSLITYLALLRRKMKLKKEV